tara:strand:+ start:84 stop:767 length:684 start_codon:yes stop_codon:yes gene_type:complete
MEIKLQQSIPKLDLATSSGFTDHEALVVKSIWARSSFPQRHKDQAKKIHCEQDSSCPWSATYNYMIKKLGDQGSLFILTGKRGTGKTQMSACLGRLFALKLSPVKYFRVADVFTLIRATFDGEGSEVDVLKQMTGALASWANPNNSDAPRLLVIDELHDRGGSEWEARVLNQVVDARYGAKLDTILITNDLRKELVGKIGPSIISRADETGGIIECLWDSFRSPETP